MNEQDIEIAFDDAWENSKIENDWPAVIKSKIQYRKYISHK